MMYKIGLDLRSLEHMHTGIQRYALNMAKGLIKYKTEQYCIFGRYAHDDLAGAERIACLDLPLSEGQSLNTKANKLLAFTGYVEGIDLLYSPYYSIPERRTFAGILQIHDLIVLRFPEFFSNVEGLTVFFNNIKNSAKSCDHIIAVSEAAKRDIIELFAIEPEKISVVPSAPPSRFFSEFDDMSIKTPVLDKYHLDSPYVLSVCTIEPRKNLIRVLKAFEILREKAKEKIKLVFAGTFGWKFESFLEEYKLHKFRDDIVLTGYVADDELKVLYKNARVFVYASLCEGFGLPVLEAMCFGIPVVTSGCSSMPEVAGEAAVYCDPYQPESIAAALEKAIYNESLRQSLINLGKTQVRNFTWEKNAKKMRDIFLSVLGG